MKRILLASTGLAALLITLRASGLASTRDQSPAIAAIPGATIVSPMTEADQSMPLPDGDDDPGAPSRTYPGLIVARESADVASRIEGVLTAVHVRPGDHVHEGEIVATTDAGTAAGELEKARATLQSVLADERSARVEFAAAQLRLKRREELLAEGLVSREERDGFQAQCESAGARFDAAHARTDVQRAQIAILEQSVRNQTIRAPFAGTVMVRFLDPGSAVHPGMPVLNLAKSGGLWVRFAVPADEGHAVAAGTTAEFRAPSGIAIRAVVDATSTPTALSHDLIVEARLLPGASVEPQLSPGVGGVVSLPSRY